MLIAISGTVANAEEWIGPHPETLEPPMTSTEEVWYQPSTQANVHEPSTYKDRWSRTKKIDPTIQNGQLSPLHGAKYPSHPQIAPYAGHYGQGQTSGTFRWGWFGSEHFYPQVRWHAGYNREVYRWSHQRRY